MPYNMLDKKGEGWIHDEGRAGDHLETPPILSHNPALHILGSRLFTCRVSSGVPDPP